MERSTRTPLLLVGATFVLLAISLIFAHDRLNWVLETFPILIGLPILMGTYKKCRLTTFMYGWLVFHSAILCLGAIYTYAKVPLGFWMMDWFGFTRNHYDRIGHFFQGFIPALLVREVLLRTSPLKPGKWLTFLVICVALAISAFYELIEFAYTVAIGASAEAFLGTQGDVWDAQWDMTFALAGSMVALALFSRLQTRLVTKT